MTGTVALVVHWTPVDQGRLLTQQVRRAGLLGAGAWTILAYAALCGLGGALATRLAVWAVLDVRDPAPLLAPPGGGDAIVAGGALLIGAALAILQPWGVRLGLTGMLDARAHEQREPLLGKVAVTLSAGRVTCRGERWETSADVALLTRVEEAPDQFVLHFGSNRALPLPRRDLSAAEAQAVRDWAAPFGRS